MKKLGNEKGAEDSAAIEEGRGEAGAGAWGGNGPGWVFLIDPLITLVRPLFTHEITPRTTERMNEGIGNCIGI